MPSDSPPRRDKCIPMPIAVGVLAAVFIIGAGVIGWHKLWRRPAPRAMNAVTPSADNPRVARLDSDGSTPRFDPVAAARQADLPDGIYDSAGGVLVKAGDAYARVARDGAARFGFFSLSDRRWEHAWLSQGADRIIADPSFAAELNITPDQLDSLKRLPPGPPDWPEADCRRIVDGLARWRSADPGKKGELAADVLQTLREVARRKEEADDRIMAQRLREIRAILSGEQVGKLNPIPRWERE